MQSEKIELLAKDLNKVQAELRPAAKDAKNPFFHSKYATLAAIWESCREILTKYGFAVVQAPGIGPNGPTLTTTLLHTSGQWISGEYALTPVKNDPQALGSAFSYARRYCLAAMVGVVTEDDDAEAAMPRKEKDEYTTAIQASKILDIRKTSFLPADVIKLIDKETKKAVFEIKSPDGVVFSTTSEDFAKRAKEAKEKKLLIAIKYVQKGKFFDIADLDISLEDVPF